MQLLLGESDEGPGRGLDVIPGRVTKLTSPRTPHMGWSRVDASDPKIASALPAAVYYAHSFACRPSDPRAIVATTEVEGDRFAAIVRRERTIGCQFHPEKSSLEGVAFLGFLVREATR